MDLIGYHNTVEYALISQSQGRVVIPEPINFDDGNGNIYERDEESKGFLKSKSNDLEFYRAGSDFLLTQAVTKGIAEDAILEKSIKSDDRMDELWRKLPVNYLDMGELQFTQKSSGENVAKTKVTEGGLKAIIDARMDDEFDLTATVDVNGNTISALSTNNVALPPREIFLRSVLNVEDGTIVKAVVSGGDTLNARSVPFEVEINSDQDNIDFVLDDKLSAAGGNYATLSSDKVGNCWLTSSETNKVITINGKVKATITNAQPGSWTLDLVVYEGGNAFTVKEITNLDAGDPSVVGNFVEYTFSNYQVTINQGDSVAIGLLSNTFDGIAYSFSETEIVVTEDSSFAQTEARCLTYKQAINRLLYIITGTDELLISDLLTTGELSEDVLSNGFWIRGFPDVVVGEDEEERKIQFNVSLSDVFDHIEALLPKAWWIETIGDTQYLRLEPYSYTQQGFVGVNFANTVTNLSTGKSTLQFVEASKIKRKLLKGNFYSKIEIGSEKGGDGYEEVFGLQSVCGKATFATINKNSEAVYSKLSPFRLGDVDVELPRRKPYNLYREEDTRYDSDIMAIRAKLINGKFFPIYWPEIYESAPSGIYRPNSAYNLEWSPAQLLLKHGANINAGLYHYPNEKIIFSSSNCNSSFASKKAGEDLVDEDQPIPHTRLAKPTIRPFSMECVAKVSQEIEDNIVGTTDGVQNWFGLVALNTGIQIEYFRLIKSDVNKEGKHKFVEAYLL